MISSLLALALLIAPGSAAFAAGPATCTRKITPIQTPHPVGIQLQLDAVATVPGTTQAWAVGWEEVNAATGQQVGVALRYLNGAWKVVSTPTSTSASISLSDVSAISASNVWAVGSLSPAPAGGGSVIEHWNGTSWNIAAEPTDGSDGYVELTSIASISSTNVWAAGDSDRGAIVMHYDGSSWTSAWPTGFTDLNPFGSIRAVPGTLRVWATGYGEGSCCYGGFAFQYANGVWSDHSMGGWLEGAGGVYALTIPGQRDVWAFGDNDGATAWHFNGATWTTYPIAGTAGFSGAGFKSTTDVWAVGDANHFAHWNGSAWTVVNGPSSLSDAWLPGIAIFPSGAGWAIANHNTTDQAQLVKLACF